MQQNIGILGYGEIGKAIEKFYQDPIRYKISIADKDFDRLASDLNILHVCIPDSKDFKKIILHIASKHNPEYIVIHSTVKVGTTKWLNERLNKVVHSPCMGVHPNLYEGIKTFKKFIGCDDIGIGGVIQDHFNEIGIEETEVVIDSRNTELGKLLDTTYYGLCISYHGYINDLCKKLDLDFNTVATDFNETYNWGYSRLGMPQVIRPVLKAPENKIGGHCIIPNAKILMKQFGINNILKSILKYK